MYVYLYVVCPSLLCSLYLVVELRNRQGKIALVDEGQSRNQIFRFCQWFRTKLDIAASVYTYKGRSIYVLLEYSDSNISTHMLSKFTLMYYYKCHILLSIQQRHIRVCLYIPGYDKTRITRIDTYSRIHTCISSLIARSTIGDNVCRIRWCSVHIREIRESYICSGCV